MLAVKQSVNTQQNHSRNRNTRIQHFSRNWNEIWRDFYLKMGAVSVGHAEHGRLSLPGNKFDALLGNTT